MEELYLHTITANKDKVFRICKSYTIVQADAEDLFQEVLLQIWKAMPGFKGQASINTWVYRIALNVCLSWTLKQKKEKQYKVALGSVQFEYVLESTENKDCYYALYSCIHRLGDIDKGVVLLYLEDLPYKEIAEILSISENNVAVKMKRIREKLFQCLKT